MNRSTAEKTSLNFETHIANIYYDNYNSHINDNYSNKGRQRRRIYGGGYESKIKRVHRPDG